MNVEIMRRPYSVNNHISPFGSHPPHATLRVIKQNNVLINKKEKVTTIYFGQLVTQFLFFS